MWKVALEHKVASMPPPTHTHHCYPLSLTLVWCCVLAVKYTYRRKCHCNVATPTVSKLPAKWHCYVNYLVLPPKTFLLLNRSQQILKATAESSLCWQQWDYRLSLSLSNQSAARRVAGILHPPYPQKSEAKKDTQEQAEAEYKWH